MRWLWLPLAAMALTWLLFLLMHYAIRADEELQAPDDTLLEAVQVVRTPPREDKPPDPLKALDSAPPPPPAAPPALANPQLPTLSLPALDVSPVEVGSIAVPIGLSSGGASLGSSGVFGGFARGSGSGGSGTGGSGGGGGGGATWQGKPLVPLSTARPQMPEWACKQKIKGWVEAVFTVDKNGRVRDVKIVDAEPRGVYEAAAVESISNWLYEPVGKNLEVKQRVPMDPADCAYNWR